MTQLKVFGKWDHEGVIVSDMSLRSYINLDERKFPCTFGRFSTKKFGKVKMNVVERLANKIAVTGHLKDSRVHKRVSGRDTGKRQRNLNAVRRAFLIIEMKTKKNPLQVLVQAVENAAPLEETTRIRQGGIIVHKAVDVSPQRRIDVALRFITHGAGQRSFKKKYPLELALADEIISASNKDSKCYSIAKKDESERVAASAR